tara:strand:+ start:530 stop:1150 length:621 start_codon:yes stop_codon:yes gene_type:complete
MSDIKPHLKVGIHRLYSSDKNKIRAHFMRLDAESRRSRFCGTVSDGEVVRYVDEIFGHDSIICGALIDGKLRGIAELRGVYYARPAATEIAFSVEKDWQNRGIGDALFDRVFAIAQNRGVRMLHMLCLRDNNRMKRIAVKHNAEVSYGLDGMEAVLRPDWPTPLSIAQEVMGETSGYVYDMTARSCMALLQAGRKAMQALAVRPAS